MDQDSGFKAPSIRSRPPTGLYSTAGSGLCFKLHCGIEVLFALHVKVERDVCVVCSSGSLLTTVSWKCKQ